MLTTYLCGPINGCTDEECNDWRTLAKILLDGPTIDPMRRDYRGKEGDFTKDLVELDKFDVAHCDVTLASCPKPSVGTSMEILLAWQQGKLTLAVIPPDSPPPSPWLVYHTNRIFTSYEAACAFINDYSKEMQ